MLLIGRHESQLSCEKSGSVVHESSPFTFRDLVVVVVELPSLLCTVVGRKPANPPQEGDDIRRFRRDKLPVWQERLPEGFPLLLTPRRTSPHEMFSVFFFSFARFTCSVIFQPNSLPVSFEKSAMLCSDLCECRSLLPCEFSFCWPSDVPLGMIHTVPPTFTHFPLVPT